MDRFDPFVKYADVYGDIINWEKDPMNKPQNQNKYFFSDGKTYYEQICKMLRLMSVFKEAFNQIYSNEDEISEAWENFVNNLSASVVEGSEPDVTLTWTDDSVNFEFTMVPGVPGEQGVGITSISFNSDYTMTITLSDGNTYTSMSLKGETGPQGPQGETGSGLQILDVYATLADLQSAHPTGQPGDAYQVGSEGSYTMYIWSSSQSAWVPAGSLGIVSPSLSNPIMDGTASAGSQNLYSRGDHVHPSDTSRASKEELDALIKTSQSLIDQSFTYRESPAIQDGLARIDKIKGNTLVWNQLQQSASESQTINGITYTVNNDGYITANGTATATSIFYLPKIGQLYANHKYLVKGCPSGGTSDTYMITFRCNGFSTVLTNEVGNGDIVNGQNYNDGQMGIRITGGVTLNNAKFYPQAFDLTKMGMDISSPSEFTSIFPLPYYDYNAGTFLSFNGNGLKTTGKNLCPKFANGSSANLTYTVSDDGSVKVTGTNTGTSFYAVSFTLPAGTYVLSGAPTNGQLTIRSGRGGGAPSSEFSGLFDDYGSGATFTVSATATAWLNIRSTAGTHDETYYPMIRFADTDDTYEPYTESTASLPISTYFPNGMKSKGDVCDELTETKAITRIGSRAYQSGDESDTSVITDGTNTYYVLDTPTETDVDLDLSFMAYENGTEQSLPVNGSVPSTSPVIADMTYLSIDDAMEYIIDKLANVPQNTQQILESLEDDVSDLQTDVGALQPAVSALQTSVGNINTNIGQLSSTVAGHTASISDMQSDISDLNTGLSNLENTVTDNTSRIGTLETGLSATNGNVQSLSSQVQSIDGRVTNLETDLLIVVKKEYDYDSVAGNTDFGVQTGLSQEPGYKIIGIVGSEVQQGEYTSADPWFIVTQAHVHYTSTGGVVLSMMARNVSQYTKTNVRVYLYLLCIKDTQSQ